ncbi:MAG: Ig-like domain-containing protein [Gemmatimonadetes bacterium]|nr:Ig-like domain-containing protein [Candidatus Palauibacter rhopaloidicola]
MTVDPGSASFTALGETARFTAEVRDQNGQVMAGATVAWASSDASVATADASGQVTAAGNGAATITARAGSASGAAEVSVAQEVDAVAVTPAVATLVAFRDTVRLVAEATDANGHGVAGIDISWSSSDAGVARVDDTGLVEAVAEGTATIAAEASETSGTAEITTVENPERAALVALYEATDGPNWVDNTNWLTDAPLGEWYGVGTDAAGRVVRLDLAGRVEEGVRIPHGLSGPIPSQIASLGSLQELRLSLNDLSGSIPPELVGLANLEGLFLLNNDLSGPIPPELGELANLRWLMLQDNSLSGQIPAELGNLLALRTMRLGSNNLFGPIPPELGKLTNLEWLSLSRNRLTGPIPAELGNLKDLRQFSVSVNLLTGPIPGWLRNFTNLVLLHLAWNNWTGPIPPWLGTLTNLESLNLARSGLTGPIPPELGRLTKLRRLGLGGNELTGSLPRALANLTNLEELEIGSNLLTGPLPQEFVNLPKLKSFGCSNAHGFCVPGTRPFSDWIEGIESFEGSWCNQLDATVLESLYEATDGPDWHESGGWLGDPALGEWHGVRTDTLGRVTAIDLEGNGLAGQVPSNLGYLSELMELRIGDNNALSGRLPISLAGLPLSTLHYAGTDLCSPTDGSFREWLHGVASHEGTGFECSPVSEREVLADVYRATGGPRWADSDKWLTDAPLGEWDRVETDGSGRVVGLNLSWNNLSGPIPPELGTLAHLEILGLSGNELNGPIPPELGDLENLELLQLTRSNLSGAIPRSWARSPT